MHVIAEMGSPTGYQMLGKLRFEKFLDPASKSHFEIWRSESPIVHIGEDMGGSGWYTGWGAGGGGGRDGYNVPRVVGVCTFFNLVLASI